MYIESDAATLGDPETGRNDWVPRWTGSLQLLWTMNDLLNKEIILETIQGHHQGPSKLESIFFIGLDSGLSSLIEIKLPHAVFKSD